MPPSPRCPFRPPGTKSAAKPAPMQDPGSTTPSSPRRTRCATGSGTSPRMRRLRACAAWRPDATRYRDPAVATRLLMTSLARGILALDEEIAALDRHIAPLARRGDCSRSARARRRGRRQRGAKSSASSRASTTHAASTRRSATNRRPTSRNSTMRLEANLRRRGVRSSPGFSGLLASSTSLVTPLHRWKSEKRNHIRHHQSQEPTVRESGATPGHLHNSSQ